MPKVEYIAQQADGDVFYNVGATDKKGYYLPCVKFAAQRDASANDVNKVLQQNNDRLTEEVNEIKANNLEDLVYSLSKLYGWCIEGEKDGRYAEYYFRREDKDKRVICFTKVIADCHRIK